MRIADLFCGAGGAGAGYALAGFDVVGVDIDPQPDYPYEFIQGDALTFDLTGFDAVHASPPCQRYSAGAGQMRTRHLHPDLIAPCRDRLRASGLPYVIENIELARSHLILPTMLCGVMFGLGVFRHRLFETSWRIYPPPRHRRHRGRVGDGRYFTIYGHSGGFSNRDGIYYGTTEQWQQAMGIGWATGKGLSQAIPPAYTHYIAQQLLSKEAQ